MALKEESKFRAKFRKQLNLIENCWWESIQQKSINGTPDIIGCVAGCFVAIELKAHHDSPTSALQLHKLRLITGAGGVGLLVHPVNAYNALELIREMAKKGRPA